MKTKIPTVTKGTSKDNGEQIGEAAPAPAHMLPAVVEASCSAEPGPRWTEARGCTCHEENVNRRPEPVCNHQAGLSQSWSESKEECPVSYLPKGFLRF